MFVVSTGRSTPTPKVYDATCTPDEWKWNPHTTRNLFLDSAGNERQKGDLERLERVLKSSALLPFGRMFVYAAYENPTGKAGGLYPVAENLPRAFRDLRETAISTPEPDHMIRVSPFHKGGNASHYREAREAVLEMSTSRDSAAFTRFARCEANEIPLSDCAQVASRSNEFLFHVGTCQVPFGEPDHNWERSLVDTNIYRLLDIKKDGSINDWYLFEAKGFFEANTPPYSYHGDHDSHWKSQKDFLFGSRAIPEVLKAIGISENIVLLPQDFHLAASVLTFTEQIAGGYIKNGHAAIGLHNVFDFDLTPGELRHITDRSADEYWLDEQGAAKRHTHLSRMIGLTSAPLMAVSEGFAAEIVDRPYKLPIDTNLHFLMKFHGVTGLPNGVFGRVRTKPEIVEATRNALSGDVTQLVKLKLNSQQELLKTLAIFLDSQRRSDLQDGGRRVIGHWQEEDTRDGICNLANDIPIFSMMGRFDWNQKGHLLALKAIADHIPKDLNARFVIGAAGFSRELYGDVMFGQMEEVAMRSAGRLVFLTDWLEGNLREGLFSGSSWAIMPSLYEPFGMVPEWRGSGRDSIGTPVIAHNTGGLGEQIKDSVDGLLFSDSGYNNAEDWRGILSASSPYDRMAIPTYNGLTTDLGIKIQQAVKIYQDPLQYGQMLAKQPTALSNNSWLTCIFGLVALINSIENR